MDRVLQHLLFVLECATILAVSDLAGRPSAAEPVVDVALVLAIDTSDSVGVAELDLQRRGYSQALVSREVLDAIRSNETGRIAVMMFEWAGEGEQTIVVPWTIVGDGPDARRIATQVQANRPSSKPANDLYLQGNLFDGGTAVGDALAFAEKALGTAPSARHRVIDISGDGANNDGVEPAVVRDRLVAAGITVNGLPILTDVLTLDAYYAENVVGGPSSFILAVRSYRDIETAVREKLVAEIAARRPGASYALARAAE